MVIAIDDFKQNQGRVSYTTRARMANTFLQSPRVPCVMLTDIEELGWQSRTHREAQTDSHHINMSIFEHASIQGFSKAVKPLQGSQHKVRESSWQLVKRRETFALTKKPLVSRIWSVWVNSLCFTNSSPSVFSKTTTLPRGKASIDRGISLVGGLTLPLPLLRLNHTSWDRPYIRLAASV